MKSFGYYHIVLTGIHEKKWVEIKNRQKYQIDSIDTLCSVYDV